MVTVTSKVTVSFRFGAASLTVFVIARSAATDDIEALAESFVAFGSCVPVAVMEALLVTVLVVVTVATISRVALPPLAIGPTVHLSLIPISEPTRPY